MAYNPTILRLNAANVTGATTVSIPPSTMIQDIVIENTTANNVLGGVKMGTTLGATDVVTTIAANGNTLSAIPNATLTKRVFSLVASTVLYIDAVTAFNSATLNIYFILIKIK